MKTKAFAIIVCLVLLPILTSVCFGDETEIRYRWTRSMGGIYNEVPRAKTIDSSGNIYVTGSFEGTVDFGFDFGTTDIKASAGKSDRDIFITKIMSDGTYGWTKHIGCNTYGYVFHEIATAIVTDSSDDVYITGGFGLTVDFGLDFGVTDIKTSGGNLDIFVTKINSDGTYGWTKCMGGQWSQWDDIGRCICADSSDNIYVAGYFFATVDFGLDFGTTDEKDGWGGETYLLQRSIQTEHTDGQGVWVATTMRMLRPSPQTQQAISI